MVNTSILVHRVCSQGATTCQSWGFYRHQNVLQSPPWDLSLARSSTHSRGFSCSFPLLSARFLALLYMVSYSVSVCRDDSAEVDVYNPQKNEWDKITPMNQVCSSR